MEAFGLNSLMDLVQNEILSKLPEEIEDLIDLDVTKKFEFFDQFDNIANQFDGAFNAVEVKIRRFMELIEDETSTARGLLDPSIDASQAMADSVVAMNINDPLEVEGWSGTGQFRMAFSDNGERVTFQCDQGYYPIVFDGKCLQQSFHWLSGVPTSVCRLFLLRSFSHRFFFLFLFDSQPTIML